MAAQQPQRPGGKGGAGLPDLPRSTTMHPVANAGMIACFGTVAGSVVVGGIAYMGGNKALFRAMFKARMVVVATAIGLYSAGSGWLPPPPLLNTLTGRLPRPPLVRPIVHIDAHFPRQP